MAVWCRVAGANANRHAQLVGKVPPTGAAIAALCLFAASCAEDNVVVSATDDVQPVRYELETIAEGLAFPWCLAFLPGGEMLVTERGHARSARGHGGALRAIRDGRLDPTPIAGVPAVLVGGHGGLFDVLPHPQFATNRWLYLSYAHAAPEGNATRLARARYDGKRLTDIEVLFTVAPRKRRHLHYGGRMMFLPDGTLLLTTGDGFVHREAAQRLDNLLGKVVRLRDDGTVPPDNPFVADANALDAIWTLGHRNPQGLALATVEGEARVYLHEHGPRGGDELNLLAAGANYGWPVATFGIDYNGAVISPFTEYPGMADPLLQWTPSIAPAGMAWYDGDLFPAWRGDLFVTSLEFMNARRIDLEGGQVVGQETLFAETGQRLRDVRTGPDGHLYLLTDARNGRVVRVHPAADEAP